MGAASGRAGQHFELFDSILGRVKKVTTHNHSLSYSMKGNAKSSI